MVYLNGPQLSLCAQSTVKCRWFQFPIGPLLLMAVYSLLTAVTIWRHFQNDDPIGLYTSTNIANKNDDHPAVSQSGSYQFSWFLIYLVSRSASAHSQMYILDDMSGLAWRRRSFLDCRDHHFLKPIILL